MIKFEFAVATEITEYAKKHFPYTYQDCEKVFITPDVDDHHILRILKDVGDDYETVKGSYVLEWDKIPHIKHETLTMKNLNATLEKDDGSNWDYAVFDSIEKCIEEIDGGFGIN